MKVIKNYTDVEQSKKLSEFLSIESADMYYPNRIDIKYQGTLPIEFKHGNPLLSLVFTQNFPDDAGIMRVAIAHRPDPKGWDGKSIATGKIEHYTPKTYGKGGWNIPDVKYWIDIELPKEIEL